MSTAWRVEPRGGDEEVAMSVSSVTVMRNERELVDCRSQGPVEMEFGTHPAEGGRDRPFPKNAPWWTSQQGESKERICTE